MISIDFTLFFQLANFLVTLVILNCLIIRPIREVLAKRRAQNSDLLKSAQAMNTDAAHKLESYDARLLRARVDMAGIREEAKREAEKSSQARLDSASGDARSIRQEATGRLHEESSAAQRALESRVDEFTRLAVAKVLGA